MITHSEVVRNATFSAYHTSRAIPNKWIAWVGLLQGSSQSSLARDAPQKALPLLIGALSLPEFDDETRRLEFEARDALKNLGPKAIPSLLNALNSDDSRLWANAADILGELKTGEATLKLIDKLKSIPAKDYPDPRRDIVKPSVI